MFASIQYANILAGTITDTDIFKLFFIAKKTKCIQCNEKLNRVELRRVGEQTVW